MRFRLHHPGLIALCLALVLLGLGCARTPEQINQRAARKLAVRMLDAMGGERALNEIRFLQFDFVIEDQGRQLLRRTHLWDRQTGDYRLEWHEEAWPVLVLFNTQTLQGNAWQRLRAVQGPEAEALLRQAVDAWLNDSFWLLSCERLIDQDAQLAYDGDNLVQGRLCPTLELVIGDGGAPGARKRYWYYIDSRTDLPFAWAFDSGEDAKPLKTFLWKEWRTIGDFSVPTRFESLDDAQAVRFINLFSPASISPRVFNAP